MVGITNTVVAALLLFASSTYSIQLDITSRDSICAATDTIQKGIMDYYWGSEPGGIVGMFKPPYYWWEAGEVFGGMMENWYLCDNNNYNSTLLSSMVAQTGVNYDYIPSNQSTTEGNDDQGFWAMFIMQAVERNYPDAKINGIPGWLGMAQAIFNTMWARWDGEHCGGGLRWQIFMWNIGYDYKNTIANGCLFTLAARLGRYTGNTTYLDIASKVFEWLLQVNYVVLTEKANVFDGAHIGEQCKDINKLEWSYNHGMILGGAAYMYNATGGSDEWKMRVQRLLDGAIALFFQDRIMYEKTCKDRNACNNDQRSFKSFFSRMLGITSVLCPFTKDTIMPLLEASAQAAANSCSGGRDGVTCGMNWLHGGYDGVYGLGEQASALEVIQNLLIHSKPGPITASGGGSSVGNNTLGLGGTDINILQDHTIISGKDRVVATLITAVSLGIILGAGIWMIL